MSTVETLESLSQHCKNTTGDTQTWVGNKSSYHWNRGKTAADGTVNGVVRKLAGIDAGGKQIWVVAGSFKIAPNGTIIRFTGLPKKIQTLLNGVGNVVEQAKQAELTPV